MIERLVIHRFRGIREGALDKLGNVNLLIGPNNSGKTAILEMLYLGGVSGRPSSLILDNVPDGVYEATAPLRYDFLGLEPTPRLRRRHGLQAYWKEPPITLTVEHGLEVTLSDLPITHPLHDFRLGAPLSEPGVKDKIVFYKKDIGVVALFSIEKQKGIPPKMIPPWFETQKVQPERSRWHYLWQPGWVYKWEQSKPIDHLAVWAEEGTPSDPSHVLFFDFHMSNAHFTERFAQWAKNRPWDWSERIRESLGRVFPHLEGAKIEIDDAPDGQLGESGYIRFPGQTRLAVDHFGDGTRHAFKVLASLIALVESVDDEHPGLFLWEDPELFMHPESLGRLLKEIVSLINEKPIQLFCSTQSLEVLGWIGKMLDDAEMAPDALRVFSLGLAQSGKLNIRLFQGTEINEWLRSGFDARDADTGMIDISPLSWRLKPSEEDETLW